MDDYNLIAIGDDMQMKGMIRKGGGMSSVCSMLGCELCCELSLLMGMVDLSWIQKVVE